MCFRELVENKKYIEYFQPDFLSPLQQLCMLYVCICVCMCAWSNEGRGVRKRKQASKYRQRTEERIRGENTCMLLNQTVAERSHRVGPAHTGIMAVLDDLET